MKKKTKILIFILVLAAAVLTAGSFGAGNYLVDYALYRTDQAPESAHDGKAPVGETCGNEEANKAQEQALTDAWLETVSIEKTEIVSEDGLTLRALQYTADPSAHHYALVIHGYTSNKEAMQTEARHFSELGYTVITPDNRAHGESDGSYIGMGWLDRKDLLLWIQQIVNQDSQAEIILYGVSMGGAAVMMTAGEQLPDNVKAVIEDCGYTSVYDMFKNQLDYRFGLPEFPFLATADVMTGIRAGYHFKEASALEQLKKASVPMMFIHGSNDTYVPTDMVYQVFEACPTEKELLVIEGAAHAASADVDPELYWNSVTAFLNRFLN